ncbi:hypothetical protein [Methanosarcina barkeri]|uniref:hypothetical protein n=1 Tax=Methanosarcina barkeri TaxID=2208 RepID=UPI000B297EFE|nr:hypothetical protein [Methanosarcina barkeri]
MTLPTHPQIMFIIIAFLGFIFILIVTLIKKHYTLSKTKKTVLGIAVIFYLTFFLISFSAFMGPIFFQKMGYNVNNTTADTITAFDTTNCLASSILAATFGYMAIETSQNESKKKEEDDSVPKFSDERKIVNQ